MIMRSKANDFLKQLWRSTTSDSVYYYLGLSTTVPNNDGSNFTEPKNPGDVYEDEDKTTKFTGEDYARKVLGGGTDGILMGTATNGILKNANAIMFHEAEHYDWGKIKYFGIFTSSTASTPIFVGKIESDNDEGIDVPKGYIPVFRANKLQIGIDNDPAKPIDIGQSVTAVYVEPTKES